MTIELSARTSVGNHGWQLDSLELPSAVPGCTLVASGGLRGPAAVGTIVTAPAGMAYPGAFTVVDSTGAVVATESDIVAVATQGADDFTDASQGELRMRLRDPQAGEPRPLILFLHGGAEAGTDNWSQLVGTLGAARLAALYPEWLVLAPQAPPPARAVMPARRPFAERALESDTGWSRGYLTGVCDHIRSLVADGTVDATRIYLTGVSMGGAGVLRTLSVAPGLFAAAAPVCPTMTPETLDLLLSLESERLWISTAYIDHTPDRHKYIVDGVISLLRRGAEVHLSLFSPEQLESVGIPDDPALPLDALLVENHASWVLTYANAEGILDWLTAQHLTPTPSAS